MIKVEKLFYDIGSKNILKGVNLEIRKGETMAVMGMSGAGKSTLLKCIAGLSKPTSGRLLVDGTDIVPLKESELDKVRIRIGMVFQYAALFDSMNVTENVAFGLRRHTQMSESEIKDTVACNLNTVGLAGTENLMPSELSGGMKKRVGLARALAMKPDMVLYDEPTAGLDPITSATIAELIVQTRDDLGVTSVLVSHDIPTILGVSNRIAMLHKGDILAVGTAEEIQATKNESVLQFLQGRSQGPIKVVLGD